MIAADVREDIVPLLNVRTAAVQSFATASGVAALNLGSFVLIAHTLSPAALGDYAFIIAVVTLTAAGSKFGLDRALVARHQAAKRSGADGCSPRPELSAGLATSALGGIAASALIGVSLDFPAHILALVTVITIWIMCDVTRAIASEHARLAGSYGWQLLHAHFWRNAIFVALLGLFVAIGLTSLVALAAAGAFASALASVIQLKTSPTAPTVRSDQSIRPVLQTLRSGSPYFVSSIASIGLMQADLVVVRLAVGADSAGQYAVGLRIAAALALPLYAQAALTPRLMSDNHHDYTTAGRHLQKVTLATTLLTAAGLLLVLTAGDAVTRLVSGESSSLSVSVAVVLGLAALINTATGPCGDILAVTGHAGQLVMANTSGFLVALMVSLFAVLMFQASALQVAIAFLAGSTLQNIILSRRCWHLTRIWTPAFGPRS